MKQLLPVMLSAAFVAASESSALACAACFGQSDSTMARSLNASIFTLMGFIGVVLIGATSFFVFLSKRAAAGRAEQPAKPSTQPPS
jgi:hypothetical protein